MTSLRITEIFHSLQGEGRFTGYPTVFVRLTGCPLRCQYCDTEYAFHGGHIMMLDQILEHVADFDCQYVCVTGGEPLAQTHCRNLLSELCDQGYSVSLETSGALSIEGLDERVCVVMDLKTPTSNESSKNKIDNLPLLKSTDQIKFVVCDEQDYEWSRQLIKEHDLLERVQDVLISPSAGQVNLSDLADWILRDRLPVRMQVQMHKLIWEDSPGH